MQHGCFQEDITTDVAALLIAQLIATNSLWSHTAYYSVQLAHITNYDCSENEMSHKQRKAGVFGTHTGLLHRPIQS